LKTDPADRTISEIIGIAYIQFLCQPGDVGAKSFFRNPCPDIALLLIAPLFLPNGYHFQRFLILKQALVSASAPAEIQKPGCG